MNGKLPLATNKLEKIEAVRLEPVSQVRALMLEDT